MCVKSSFFISFLQAIGFLKISSIFFSKVTKNLTSHKGDNFVKLSDAEFTTNTAVF